MAREVLDNKWVLRAVSLVVLLAGWEIFSRTGIANPVLVASPTRFIRAAPSVLSSPVYHDAVLATVVLALQGLAIAAVLGIFAGAIVGRYRILDRALSPYLSALYSTPIPAFIPIITALLGFGIESKLLIIVAVAIWPILINTQQGVKETPVELLEVARSFRVSEWDIWRDVVLPASVPYIAFGLRLGVTLGLVGVAVAEFYTSPEGLGFLILTFARRFDAASLLVPLMTYTLLALVFAFPFQYAESRLASWRGKRG